ncbi:O-antigen ligase family protein [Methylobacter sp. G7]|uniref:O-antigen ligase family protein n=1 Tax=Methylobacter sp. G7 TaxID=3230117 RepID=UPI003D804435
MALIKKPMFSYSVVAEKSLLTCRYLAIIAAIAAPASTAVTSAACIAMLITWLMSGHVWQSLKISAGQPAGKILLLFFAWLIISSLYADTDWTDKISTLSSWKKLFYTFVLLGLFYPTQWKARFVYYYLAAMSLAAVMAVTLWLLDIQLSPNREIGIFMSNHSSQSLAFVVAALCCIFLLKESLSLWEKRLLVVMLALFLFNIFFISPSRSGYLALPVAAVFAIVNLYGYKKLPHILGITATALLLAVLTSSTLQQRIKLGWEEKTNYQTSEDITSIGIRVIFAQNTLELIQQKPWLGYGTSSFKNTYSAHVAAKYQDWRGAPASDPHNQYLFVWLENGLIGLLIFLAYIYTAIRQGATQQPYGAMGASVLVAIAVVSLFNSNFKTFPEGHLLAFFVGCLLAQQSANNTEKDSA